MMETSPHNNCRLMAACLALSFVWTAHAADVPSPDSTPKFASYSITQVGGTAANAPVLAVNGDKFVAKHVTLRQLIGFGYDQQPWQIEGGPDWVRRTLFDVEGIASSHDLASDPGSAMHAMVRTLLTEQFKLQVRSTTQPVYILSKGADGTQLAPASTPAANGDGIVSSKDGKIVGKGSSTSALANTVSSYISRPVLDHTQLSGAYDFTLTLSSKTDADTLGAALHEQLGLELKSFPVQMLEIDSATALPEPATQRSDVTAAR